MTRGNITIIQNAWPSNKIYLEQNSDAYPENVLPDLFDFLMKHFSLSRYKDGEVPFYQRIEPQPISKLISDNYLAFEHVGNPCYYYEVDLTKGTITAWESSTFWVNAPKNWEERGWNCWLGENGKYGYTSWRKGKKIFHLSYKTLNLVVANDKIFATIDKIFLAEKDKLFANKPIEIDV